jgi:hypothetical protein
MTPETLAKILNRPAAKVNLPLGFGLMHRSRYRIRTPEGLKPCTRAEATDLARRGALVELLDCFGRPHANGRWMAVVDPSWIGLAA